MKSVSKMISKMSISLRSKELPREKNNDLKTAIWFYMACTEANEMVPGFGLLNVYIRTAMLFLYEKSSFWGASRPHRAICHALEKKKYKRNPDVLILALSMYVDWSDIECHQ